jgi:hypothetical protein
VQSKEKTGRFDFILAAAGNPALIVMALMIPSLGGCLGLFFLHLTL